MLLAFAIRRVATALVLILIVTTLVFLVIHLIPGDPAELLLSQGGVAPDPSEVEELRRRLGLDQPLLQQYATYMVGLLHGDFGTSLLDDHSIASEIALRLPRTLELVGTAGVMALIAGLPIGTLAAVRAGASLDRIASVLAGMALSVPVFVLGTLAILVFAQKLRWISAGGYVPVSKGLTQHVALLLMPAATIAAGLGAVVFRVSRSSVLEVLERDHVRAARARGLTPMRLVLHHVVRNALTPVVTVFGLQLGSLLGGTVLVEYVFNWPGLSGYLVSAVESRDYPEVSGIVLVVSVSFVFLNLITDLICALLDPRLRQE